MITLLPVLSADIGKEISKRYSRPFDGLPKSDSSLAPTGSVRVNWRSLTLISSVPNILIALAADIGFLNYRAIKHLCLLVSLVYNARENPEGRSLRPEMSISNCG